MSNQVGESGAVGSVWSSLSQLSGLAPNLWPGWHPLKQPALVVLPDGGGCILLGSTTLPAGFELLPGATDLNPELLVAESQNALSLTLIGYHESCPPVATVLSGTLAESYRVAIIDDRAVPLVSLSDSEGLACLGALTRGLFRAQIAIQAAADMDLLAGLVDEEREDMFDARLRNLDRSDSAVRIVTFLAQSQQAYEGYPEVLLLNNVLSNLEGRLLHGHAIEDDWGIQASAIAGQLPAVARARAFALVRRERYASMRPLFVAYERRMEIYEGLPLLVKLKLYRTLSEAGGLYRSELSRLAQLNVHGWGASRRRFRYSGMGLANLLDDLSPGWPGVVGGEGMPLDVILENAVTFDGGDGDEKLLESARQQYEYYDRMEAERAWVREVEGRRRRVVTTVLEAPGNRIIVDVAALQDKSGWYDQQSVELIGESTVVHLQPGVFTYGDGSTFVEFRGVTLIEDRRARLLHVNVPGPRAVVFGDDERLPETRSAKFTEGFELDLGAFKVRARRGTLEHEGGALLVRILA